MPNSYVSYTAAGGEDTYAVPFPYLKRTHIAVLKDGVAAADYSWLSTTQIQFDADVTAAVVIRFTRVTPSTPLFNSADGSVLTDTQLQTLGKQAIYLAQETEDRANDALTEAEAALAAVDAAAASAVASAASAVAAAASAVTAAASAASAASAFDSFDDRYLGAKAVAPTLDNDGAALVVGALYYDTVLSAMRQWDGASWLDIVAGISESSGDARYLRLIGGDLSAVPTVGGVNLVTRTSTDTLTNKTITAAVIASMVSGGQTVTVPAEAGTLLTSVSLGAIRQTVYTQTGAVASNTGTIPYDDTKPQSGEGVGFTSLDTTITPKSATNILRVKARLILSANPASAYIMIAALFKDAETDARAVEAQLSSNDNGINALELTYYMVAGATSAMTFKARAGNNTGGTTTLNGQGGSRKFGDAYISFMEVTEYVP